MDVAVAAQGGTQRRPEVGDRLAAGRSRLAQLTFYMFDPDSWR